MSRSIALSGVLLLAIGQAEAQNARHSASNIEPDIGKDVMEVASPDPATLRSFIVPAYNGRILFGPPIVGPDERPLNTLRGTEQAARMRGNYVRTSGLELYLNLLRLSENSDVITTESLQGMYTSAKRPLNTEPFMRGWAPLMESSARGALADGPYREVFCVEEVPCPLDRFNGSRPFDIVGLTPVWGAAYNEFRFRSAYATFVEKYAQALIEWGATLSRDAICTGAMRIGRYDFDRGAYTMRIGCQSSMRLPPGPVVNVSTPEYDLSFDVQQGSLIAIGLTWKLSREKAEMLRNKLQSISSNQLYIVMDGEIGFDPVDRVAMNHPGMLVRNQHFVLTGGEIRAYYDAALTEPAAVFSLR